MWTQKAPLLQILLSFSLVAIGSPYYSPSAATEPHREDSWTTARVELIAHWPLTIACKSSLIPSKRISVSVAMISRSENYLAIGLDYSGIETRIYKIDICTKEVLSTHTLYSVFLNDLSFATHSLVVTLCRNYQNGLRYELHQFDDALKPRFRFIADYVTWFLMDNSLAFCNEYSNTIVVPQRVTDTSPQGDVESLICLWDTEARRLRRYKVPYYFVSGWFQHRRGRLVALGGTWKERSNRCLFVYSVKDGRVVCQLNIFPSAVAFNPKSKTIAALHVDRDLSIALAFVKIGADGFLRVVKNVRNTDDESVRPAPSTGHFWGWHSAKVQGTNREKWRFVEYDDNGNICNKYEAFLAQRVRGSSVDYAPYGTGDIYAVYITKSDVRCVRIVFGGRRRASENTHKVK